MLFGLFNDTVSYLTLDRVYVTKFGPKYNNNSIQFSSVLYFNVLNQQLEEQITESAQEDEI
jgi:hypothetical protein